MNAPEIESLFEALNAGGRPLPPVERWRPERSGVSRMRIDREGHWYYQGSPIERPAMVRLFSRVLRKDDDGYVLVTPHEKLSIEVDDAPFVAIALEKRGEGAMQEIAFRTNVDDIVIADVDHPIEIHDDADGPRPYVAVRRGLRALLARSVYYELVGFAEEFAPGVFGVRSRGAIFEIGRL